jgi:hypothetical protein
MTHPLPLPDHVLAIRDLSGFGELDVMYLVSVAESGSGGGSVVVTGVLYGAWSGTGAIEDLVYGTWDGVALPRSPDYGRWTDG